MDKQNRTIYLLPGQKINRREDDKLVKISGPKEIQVNESDYNLYVNDLKIAIDTKDKNSQGLRDQDSLSIFEINELKEENKMLQEKVRELEIALSEEQLKNAKSEKKSKSNESKTDTKDSNLPLEPVKENI